MHEAPKQTISGQENLQAGRDINFCIHPTRPENPRKKLGWKPLGWLLLGIVMIAGVWLAAPRASIGQSFVDQEVWKDDETGKVWNVYYFEVPIMNESYTTTIRVVDFQLAELKRLQQRGFESWGNIAPVSLSPINPSQISPRKTVMVAFARVYPADLQQELGEGALYSGEAGVPQFRFTVARWLRKMTSHVEPGNYRFKLAVFLETGPPVKASFEFQWPGKRRENAGSTIEEIKIRKLSRIDRWQTSCPPESIRRTA